MTTAGTILAELILDATDYNENMDDAEKRSNTFSVSLGGLSSVLGTAGTALSVAGVALAAMGAAAVTAGVAVSGLAFSVGQELDGAFDSILTGTGATGASLEGLKDDFRKVFSSIPTEAGPASDVITELNRRLGLVGDSLQGTSARILEMSRLLGGDAKANAALFSRVVGDWGIANEDTGATLDKLFKASQLTGVGVDSLMEKVVQFGSPLRLMGFTIDDSIALFSKWEKEGVNAELVMGSLRIAAGKFADAGKPLRDSLLETFDAIKNNTDASAALALGMDVFGAKAGPDMTAAIREGRFSIDDLTAALENSSGAIMATAAETSDFSEKMQVVMNQAKLAVEPFGTALFDLAGTVIDTLTPAFESALPVIQEIGEGLAAFIETLAGGDVGGAFDALMEFDAVREVFEKFGLSADDLREFGAQIESLWEKLQAGDIKGVLTDIFGPEITTKITNIVAAVQKLVDAFVLHWPEIQKAGEELYTLFKEQLGIYGPKVLDDIASAVTTLAGIWEKHGPTIIAIVKAIIAVLSSLGAVMSVVTGIWDIELKWMSGVFNTWSRIFQGDWEGAWDEIEKTVGSVSASMSRTFENAMNGILAIAGTDLDNFKQTWSNNFAMLKIIVVEGGRRIVESVGKFVIDIAKELEKGVTKWFKAAGDMIGGFISGIAHFGGELIKAAADLAGDILAAFTDVLGIHSPSSVFAGYAENVVQGYVSGLKTNIPLAVQATTLLGGSLIPATVGAGQTNYNNTHNDNRSNWDLSGREDALDIERIVRRVLSSQT